MRSRKGRNKAAALAICALLISGCGIRRFDSPFTATYRYTAVLKDGKPFFAIGEDDTMQLNAGGRFSYHIAAPGKNARGFYTLINTGKRQAFRFTYLPDSSVRTFEICRNRGKSLILCEGSMRFEYRRIR